MYKTGHYGTALLAFAPVAFILIYLKLFIPAVVAGTIIVGCTRIPDKDMWFPGLKHRGITHTLVFAVFFGLWTGGGLVLAHYALSDLTTYYIGYGATNWMLVKTGIFGGVMGTLSILAHLAADIITPTGLKPLVPYTDKRYRYPLATAANPAANLILFALGAGLTIGSILAALFLNGMLYKLQQFLPV